ncbi:MAG: molybdopterin-dependent oxidoreductase [Bacteroidetes bacterium]|nr:molybdopterin-dependent oxidoreductase [Bacteroidota bacterium]
MKNIDSKGHVTGKSTYLDDIPVRKGTLHAVAFGSPVAHGKIVHLNIQAANKLTGVVRIFTHENIPGDNQIGGIIKDEPLLAENELHFQGQPIALIVAVDEFTARKARKLIKLDYEEIPPITDIHEAKEKGQFLFPPRTFQIGDVENTWSKCTHILEGEVESGAQEHLYIETQGAYACPMENDCIKIHSSTQGPTLVQKITAKVLALPMHKIEVEVGRIGGAFGGKEDQATAWAVMAAVAAQELQRPVKMALHRQDDIRMTGKRHPYSSKFKIGLSKDLKILAYEAEYLQNGGACADLSPAILERTLFHATGSYYVPNMRATAYSCKTNLPPNTAFRGFGAPQAMFVLEAAIAKAANVLSVSARLIQEKNLIREKDEFPYGQIAENVNAGKSWKKLKSNFNIQKLENEIESYNMQNLHSKKGMALMPVCFGISFTKTPMNQARALVHIYQDGSVGISTGAVEMGQGVNTKLLQVAAKTFSISEKRIKLETTNTTRVANTSPTAASSGADLNGKALEKACTALLERLKNTAAKMSDCHISDIEIKNEQVFASGKPTDIKWGKLVETAFLNRENLTESAHYVTPIIHFDKSIEKGHPFAYHVYGAAAITVTLDCIRGTYEIDEVKIVHDFGTNMNTHINQGQIEGGVVQGIGWMTLEEVAYNKEGRLLSDSLSTYKVPDIYFAPKSIDCKPLETEGPKMAILKSKAIGEPPFMYGIAAFFAIQNAIKAFNPAYTLPYSAPLTPEKVLLALYGK